MNYSVDQVVKGISNYADNEVMGKLPTSGKWILGTVITLAINNAYNIVDSLQHNPIMQMIGAIDEDGLINVDEIINAMREAADRYGNVVVNVPMLGSMTFSSADVERLRSYI